METDRWLTETVPAGLVVRVYGKWGRKAKLGESYDPERLRVFACACCRSLWDLLDDDHRRAVAMLEDHASSPVAGRLVRARQTYRAARIHLVEEWDRRWGTTWGSYGLLREFGQGVDPWWRWHNEPRTAFPASLAERLEITARCFAASAVWKASENKPTTAGLACTNAGRAFVYRRVAESARAGESPPVPYYPHYAGPDNNPDLCHLLRDIIGNPDQDLSPPLASLTPDVVSLARAAYDEAILPSGQLDPARLAVLADALEEAGAEQSALDHLRGPGPHVRGCYVVASLLA